MKTIGEVLREAIDRTGVTLYRVAKDSGLDCATVYRFYHGEREAKQGTLEALAEYLGLELKPQSKRRG